MSRRTEAALYGLLAALLAAVALAFVARAWDADYPRPAPADYSWFD